MARRLPKYVATYVDRNGAMFVNELDDREAAKLYAGTTGRVGRIVWEPAKKKRRK